MINAFLGLPIPFKDICKIYPPTVEEVFSNEDYGYFHTIFTMTQEQLEDELLGNNNNIDESKKIPTPFEFLLIQAYNDKDAYQKIKDGFNFFCREEITILFDRKEIWLCNLEQKVQEINNPEELLKIPKIDENNFFDFQNIIRISLGEKEVELPKKDEDPRVKRIKAKARYREKIKAKQGKGLSVESIIESICCMGIGITPLNIRELSYQSISKILNRYQMKEKYDIDIKSLLAGADSKKIKPKYWITNDIE